MENNQKDRKLSDKIKEKSSFYKKTGLYKAIFKNVLILLLIVILLVGIIYVIEKHFLDFDLLITGGIAKTNPIFVFLVFLISESILGLIPPDIFIVWSELSNSPFLTLSLLAILSYTGGVIAYFIGIRINKFPKVSRALRRRFFNYVRFVKRYGGLFIVISALLPFPYAIVCTVCGLTDYSYKKLLLLGTTRFLRFFLYSLVLYKMFNFEV